MLVVAEKKFPPALQPGQLTNPEAGLKVAGKPRLPITGTRKFSRLPAAAAVIGHGSPLLIAGVMFSGVVPSPSQDWTVTPSLTFRYSLWNEPYTSFTRLGVMTDVSLTTNDCAP